LLYTLLDVTIEQCYLHSFDQGPHLFKIAVVASRWQHVGDLSPILSTPKADDLSLVHLAGKTMQN